MFLKRLVPKSLYRRFLLLIVLSVCVVQFVSIYVFYYSYLDVVSKHMARTVIGEIKFVKKTIDKKKYQNLLQDLTKSTGLNFRINQNNRKFKKIADSSLENDNKYDLIKPLIDPYNQFKLELSSNHITPYKIYDDGDDFLILEVASRKNKISFEIEKKRIASSRAYIFTFWMIFTAFITSIIAIIFIKNQIRSILKLSQAAEKFGRGQDVDDLKPSGSREIRSLINSFIKMKARITKQITKRFEMLSAVSHDLRTPLTRMKLQLEFMPKSQEVTDMKNDINDMEKMVNEYLDFSKSTDYEKSSKIRIRKFLRDNVTNYYKKMGKKIKGTIKLDETEVIFAKRIALKRILMNLIDNAFNYGNKVDFLAQKEGDDLVMIIEDDGPGVPDKEKEKIFKPFYRIDNSRNLDKKFSSGGCGLGLAIVMDGVISHGGNIELFDSKKGGLMVKITIPT